MLVRRAAYARLDASVGFGSRWRPYLPSSVTPLRRARNMLHHHSISRVRALCAYRVLTVAGCRGHIALR